MQRWTTTMKTRIALVLLAMIGIAIVLAPAPNKKGVVNWSDIMTVGTQIHTPPSALDSVIPMGRHSILRVESPGEKENNRKIAEQFNSMPNRGQRR